MSTSGKGFARALVVAAIALALDQISKAIVRGNISPGEKIPFVLGIDFVRVGNEGIAFGLLNDAGSLVIVIAAISFTVLLGYFLSIGERPGLWLPIGLLAGGALGNLIDRVREGAVTDFIDPPRWPAFNIADIEITLGVIALGLIYLRESEDEDEHESDAGVGAESSGRSDSVPGQR